MKKYKRKYYKDIRIKRQSPFNNYNSTLIKLKFLFILTLLFLILRFIQNVGLTKGNKFEYFCCFCAMGKKENLYSRELIEYYRSIGVEKFVFGDNNEPNTEKLSDVLQDYIQKGIVDILEIFGSTIGQGEFYGVMYEKYNKRCNWLTFFDFDEYLITFFMYIKVRL